MGVEEEAVVREFLTTAESHRQDAAQVDRLLGYLATDAAYHVCAWQPPIVGHDEIRAELLRQGEVFTDLRVKISWIASTGQRVFMERLDCMNINARQCKFHLAAVFEVDDAGKIAVWRDYYDTREIASQTDIA